ncbi:hypothetical protein, partial [Brucella thiophenivorans]
MGLDGLHHLGVRFGISSPKARFKVEIIPANDGILDQAVARFGDLLIFLQGEDELARAANGHRPGKAVGQIVFKRNPLSASKKYPSFRLQRLACAGP